MFDHVRFFADIIPHLAVELADKAGLAEQHNEQRAVEGMQRPEEHFNPYLKLLNEQEELRHREQLQAVEKQKVPFGLRAWVALTPHLG